VRIRYIIGPDASVDSNDRGLAYGDGLFETMAIRAGTIRWLDLHLERLQTACQRLSIPPPDPGELTAHIGSCIDGIGCGNLKLILTRGSGPRGYAPPASVEPVVILTATAGTPVARRELKVVTLTERLGENEKLAGIKHLCRLEQVLGQLELGRGDADEGIMLSTGGQVIGGTSRNLFAVFGMRLVTPVLSRAGIAGIMRRAILERCAAVGIAAEEAELSEEDLAVADEIFMTNALVGIESVASLDARHVPARTMARTLRKALALDADA
jgi:4-amino-4-deoxychorismate lyase